MAPETVRAWLLGGFRVSVGSRNIGLGEWRLRKAAALVKLLALAPNHGLHREQAMNLLWPGSGRKAASNSLRQCDRRDAAQGNLLLRPEMRFELESRDNVEAPTAEVQRVDLRRILFGVIGEGIEVGAPQATGGASIVTPAW
jgi:hypothetical protein